MAVQIRSAFEGILEQCSELAEDVTYPSVKRWREEHPGGHAVGHFQVYFPEELIHAAGMLPITLMGAGSRLEARRMRKIVSRVAAWVEPSAPHVTEANRGASGSSLRSVRQNCSPASGLRGGKNSRLNRRCGDVVIWREGELAVALSLACAAGAKMS